MFTDEEIMQLWRSQGGQGQPDSQFMAALRTPDARTKYAPQWQKAQQWQATQTTPTQGGPLTTSTYNGKNLAGFDPSSMDFQTGRVAPGMASNPASRWYQNLAAGQVGPNNMSAGDKQWAGEYGGLQQQSIAQNFQKMGISNPWVTKHLSGAPADMTPLWQKQGLKPYQTPAPTTGGFGGIYTVPGTKPAYTPPPATGLARPAGGPLSTTIGHNLPFNR